MWTEYDRAIYGHTIHTTVGPYNDHYSTYDTSTDNEQWGPSLQLPNCITAARESRRNFGIVRQAETISPERYHGPVVLPDTANAFPILKALGVVVAIGSGFLESILILRGAIRLDYVPGNAVSSRTIDHLRRTSTQDVRRRTDCYFNARAFSYRRETFGSS